MLASSDDAPSLGRVKTRQVGQLDFFKRRCRIGVMRRLRLIAGQPLFFSWFFNRAMQVASNRSRFALYPAWVQYYCGEQLCVPVPTGQIQYYMADWLQSDTMRFHSSDYFLASGKWEGVLHDIERMPILDEARELIAAGWNFKATKTYCRLSQAINNGAPISRQHVVLDSEVKIAEYFHRFQSLFQSILECGLLANRTIAQQTGIPADREIGVAIDADGSLVKLPGGQHRFALAAALNIEVVPVEIRMVHVELLSKVSAAFKTSYLDSLSLLLQALKNQELPQFLMVVLRK